MTRRHTLAATAAACTLLLTSCSGATDDAAGDIALDSVWAQDAGDWETYCRSYAPRADDTRSCLSKHSSAGDGRSLLASADVLAVHDWTSNVLGYQGIEGRSVVIREISKDGRDTTEVYGLVPADDSYDVPWLVAESARMPDGADPEDAKTASDSLNT